MTTEFPKQVKVEFEEKKREKKRRRQQQNPRLQVQEKLRIKQVRKNTKFIIRYSCKKDSNT